MSELYLKLLDGVLPWAGRAMTGDGSTIASNTPEALDADKARVLHQSLVSQCRRCALYYRKRGRLIPVIDLSERPKPKQETPADVAVEKLETKKENRKPKGNPPGK